VFHLWYLPEPGFSLWPCAVLLLIFIPVSIWHDRNWKRTLSQYAQVRAEAGASDPDWPTPGLARMMGVQPWLVLSVTGLLAIVTGIVTWAAALWPERPAGFELPINPFDLPYLWTCIVAATAAVIAGLAIGLDAWRSPWARVARKVRRAIYASAEKRERLFAEALAADPGIVSADALPPAGPGEDSDGAAQRDAPESAQAPGHDSERPSGQDSERSSFRL